MCSSDDFAAAFPRCRQSIENNKFSSLSSSTVQHRRPKSSSRSAPSFLLFWMSLALVAASLLLIALPEQAQAAALSIPVAEMLREGDEPFERDDRDYRPLQFGKRDATYRPLQFGKKSVYRPLQFGKRGGAHYWPVDAPSNSRLVIATADLL